MQEKEEISYIIGPFIGIRNPGKINPQIYIYMRGSEKISHMSEILGMDFFAYLDAREIPEHFAF